VLDWEIEGILNLGIHHHTHVRLGVDFDVPSLLAEGYEAIFLGHGAWNDFNLGVEGESLSGSFTGIDFLARVATGEQIPIGRRAGVVGGGNTAIDCVRTLVRLGAEKVFLVYRRTRDEMPANAVEIEAAEKEGVQFLFLAAPHLVIGNDAGQVTDLEYLKMKLGEPDASGRRRPVPIDGSETRLGVDMLITAIVQRPDVSFTKDQPSLRELKITRWNTIEADPETLQSNVPYIFTAGDAATGPSLVVDAIGGGRRAARSIHQYLTGQEVKAPERTLFKQHIAESLFESVAGVSPIPRAEMPELPVQERIGSFVEADLVLAEADALGEAQRCLACCRLCYNRDRKAA